MCPAAAAGSTGARFGTFSGKRRLGHRLTVILANLGQVADDLDAGALIVISDTRIRTRRLPVKPSD
jgi:hypothetical protein